MKKLLILFIVVCLTGCVKNDDFSKTCKISTKTQNITDEVVNYITYDADDNVKKVVAVRTITALNYSGETTLKDIKESAISFNKKYAGDKNIKITVSKDSKDVYEIKYYLNALKLKDSTLDEFKLKKNSIKLFKKMRDENINCE